MGGWEGTDGSFGVSERRNDETDGWEAFFHETGQIGTGVGDEALPWTHRP